MNDIDAVYGFGSFFRSTQYQDVDLLIVASPNCNNTLLVYYILRARLLELGEQLAVHFDITFLTYREYMERPLREMNVLVPLAGSCLRAVE
jgi:predicted nucleotidyltransferase